MPRNPAEDATQPAAPDLPEGTVPLLDPSRQFWRPRLRTLLLGFLVLGGLVGGAVWLGLRKTPAERAVDLRRSAQDALAAGRMEEAALFLRDALAIDPNDAEALTTCASVAMRGERSAEAEAYLLRALAAHPGHQAANVLLARLYLRQGRDADARPYLDRAVEAAGPDASPLYVRSEARLDRGDVGGALEDLRAALGLAKDEDAPARCVLAGHLAEFLGRMLWSDTLLAEAATWYRAAPSAAPPRIGVAPAVAAEAMIGAGRTHTALALLREAPQDATTAVLRAEALRLEGSREQAEILLRDEIQSRDAAALHAALARLLAEDGRLRAAASVVQEGERRFPGDLGIAHASLLVRRAAESTASPSDLLAAVLRTDAGSFNPLEPLLAARMGSGGRPDSLRGELGFQGLRALATGSADPEALKEFARRVDEFLAAFPGDPYGSVWKAAALLRRGDPKAAVAVLAPAVAAAEATPEPNAAAAAGTAAGAGVAARARLLRALALAETGDWTEALEDVRRAAALGAPPAVAAAVESTVWLGLGDRSAARTVARRAAAAAPQEMCVAWALAQALRPAEGEAPDPALAREREVLETRLRLASMDPTAVKSAVADLARRAEHDAAAAEALATLWDDVAAGWDERERAAPDDPKAPLRHAESLLRAGRPRQADAVLRRALERMSDDSISLARVRILSGLGAYAAADAVLRPLVAARPDDVALRLESARLRIAQGDESAAGEGLRALVESDAVPAATRAEAALSLVTAETVAPKDAELVLAFLAGPRGGEVDDATRRTLTGYARLALGQAADAAAEAEAALAGPASRPDAALLAARSWLLADRPELADDLLLRALVRAPDDRRLRSLASHVRLILGLRAFDAGDRAAASRWWESAVTGGDLDFMAIAVLADLHARRGDVRESAAVVRRVSAIRTDSAAVALLRGHFESALGRDAVAAADYREALARAPGHPAVVTAYVTAALRAGDLDGAERACGAAIDLGDPLGTAHTLLAGVLDRRHDVEGAIAALREARKRDPGNFGALATLVDQLRKAERMEEARAEAAAAARGDGREPVEPPGPAERFARLRLVVESGPLVGAIDRLRAVFAGAPPSWAAEYAMGRALMSAGDLERALPWLERAAAGAPDELGPQAALLRVLSDLGRLDEAERRLADRTSLRPNDAGAWCLRGMIADHRRDADAAETHYRRALAAAPDYALASNNLACVVFERPGRQEEGIEIAAAAVRARPEVPELAATHAWLLLRAGKPDAAAWALDEAVRRHPDFALVRLYRAEAALARGQDAAAVLEYREALRLDPATAKRAPAALRNAEERASR